MNMKCSTTIPVMDLLDYLESEQKEWDGKNADRYWQTTRIIGIVKGLSLARAVLESSEYPYCEHGIIDGDFCLPCNHEYKQATIENESADAQDLKPCPFCDGKAIKGLGDGRECWYVECVVCGASFENWTSVGRAITGWNNRVRQKCVHEMAAEFLNRTDGTSILVESRIFLQGTNT